MCLTCGCGRPYDDMGETGNITYEDIKRAVNTESAEGITADEAVKNLVETWDKVKPEDKAYPAEEEE